MKAIEKSWVKAGYHSFALEGPNGLKIERLSREVGKNKSSFYHLFADLEVFTNFLLEFHLEQTHVIAEKESKCNDLEDLVTVLIDHKIDLLFNRQLRIHRENQSFEKCFLKSYEITLPSMIPIWATIIDLKEDSYLAELVLQLSLENFFLQITHENLNPDWLHGYFHSIKKMVEQFKKTRSVPSLDGNV